MKILVMALLLFAFSAHAGHLESHDLKVTLLSAWASDGGVLVQTTPRHSIDGLSCTNTYWLELDISQPGYNSLLSMVLAAQTSQTAISVRVADDNNSESCRLERVIITP